MSISDQIANEIEDNQAQDGNLSPTLANVYDAFTAIFPDMGRYDVNTYECVREQIVKALKEFIAKKLTTLHEMIEVVIQNINNICLNEQS